jgi:hypothetical protein
LNHLIEYIAKSLVDEPSAVEVNEFRRGSTVSLVLRVNKADMGRVIGKSGRVANAIRALLKVAAARENKRVSLDIEEPA